MAFRRFSRFSRRPVSRAARLTRLWNIVDLPNNFNVASGDGNRTAFSVSSFLETALGRNLFDTGLARVYGHFVAAANSAPAADTVVRLYWGLLWVPNSVNVGAAPAVNTDVPNPRTANSPWVAWDTRTLSYPSTTGAGNILSPDIQSRPLDVSITRRQRENDSELVMIVVTDAAQANTVQMEGGFRILYRLP